MPEYVKDLRRKAEIIRDDPRLWIETFCYVVNERAKVVPFIPTHHQIKILNALKDSDKVIINKSRQLGISTILLAYMLWLCVTKPNNNCLVMVHQGYLITEFRHRFLTMYHYLPKDIKGTLLKNNKNLIEFDNGSTVIIAVNGKEFRGNTFSYVHISEMSSMKASIQDQLIAIEDALSSNSTLCIESTPKGFNLFSEMFLKAQNEDSSWTPIFLTWVNDKTLNNEKYINALKDYMRRNKDNYKTKPVIEDLNITDDEEALVKKGVTVEQLIWRRQYVFEKGLDKFHQEQPTTPLEGFISSGANIFDSDLIVMMLSDVQKYPILEKYPKEITDGKNPILSVLRPYCNLVFKSPKLKIWNTPQKDKRYFLGVDTADGLGGSHDYSTIEVFDEDLEQVAEFRDNKTKPFKFADVVEALGTYYNTGLLIIETNASGNVVCEKLTSKATLSKTPYVNLYKHKDFDNKSSKQKTGITTNSKTKNQVVTYFQDLFGDGGVLIKSKDLLSEMQLFVGKDEGKSEASTGHDDCVMAACFACFGWKHRAKQYKQPFSIGAIRRRGLI